MDSKYNNNCMFLDTGPFHIPIIFDNACVFAARSQENTPINGGLVTYDVKQIEWEKSVFDRLFKNKENVKDQIIELKEFLTKGLEM